LGRAAVVGAGGGGRGGRRWSGRAAVVGAGGGPHRVHRGGGCGGGGAPGGSSPNRHRLRSSNSYRNYGFACATVAPQGQSTTRMASGSRRVTPEGHVVQVSQAAPPRSLMHIEPIGGPTRAALAPRRSVARDGGARRLGTPGQGERRTSPPRRPHRRQPHSSAHATRGGGRAAPHGRGWLFGRRGSLCGRVALSATRPAGRAPPRRAPPDRTRRARGRRSTGAGAGRCAGGCAVCLRRGRHGPSPPLPGVAPWWRTGRALPT